MVTKTHKPEACKKVKTFCFVLDDEPYESEKRKVTPQDIRDIVGDIPSNVPIVLVNEDGTQQTLQEGDEIKLVDCEKFKRLPRFRRG